MNDGIKGILLTGATGALGQLVAARAREHNIPLITLGRSALTRDGQTHPHDGSALRMRDLLGDCTGYVVVHCAAFNSPQDAIEDAEAVIDGNIRFGFSVLTAARDLGVAGIVNFGSFWQYDATGATFAVNAYAAMKTAFQELLDFAASAYGIPCTSLILSDTYSEHDTRPKLFNLLGDLAKPDAQTLAMSDGTQTIAPLHLEDLLAAIFIACRAMAERADAPTHIRYAVMGAEAVTIRDLVAMIEHESGRPLPIEWGARPRLARIPQHPYLGRDTLPDWRPQITLRDGVRRLLAR